MSVTHALPGAGGDSHVVADMSESAKCMEVPMVRLAALQSLGQVAGQGDEHAIEAVC